MSKQFLLSGVGAVALLLAVTSLAGATAVVTPQTPQYIAITSPGIGGGILDVGLSSENTGASTVTFDGSQVDISAGSPGGNFFDLSVRAFSAGNTVSFTFDGSKQPPITGAGGFTIDGHAQGGIFQAIFSINPTGVDITKFTTPDTFGPGTGGFDVFFDYPVVDPMPSLVFDLLDPNGGPIQFAFAVPEPTTLALFAFGLAGLGMRRRRGA